MYRVLGGVGEGERVRHDSSRRRVLHCPTPGRDTSVPTEIVRACVGINIRA